MPVRNEEKYIARSLAAVLAQDYPRDRMEIIVADGESTDGTRAVIRGFQADGPTLAIIDNPGRIAPTGMNVAMRRARGDIVIRVDGHCEIAPDYVRRCVDRLEHNEADGVGGPIETVGASYISNAIAAAMSSPAGVGGSAFRTIRDRALAVDTVPFPAYTRDAILRNGLYDEELVRNQDDEYNYRLRKLGGRILLAPEIRSRYYSRSTLAKLWRQYYHYGIWKVRVMQKHPRQMRLRQFAPAVLVTCLCVLGMGVPVIGLSPLATCVALYAAVLLLGGVWTASKSCWRYLPVLPVVFAALHFSYGCGFIAGLVRFRRRWTDRTGKVPPWGGPESTRP